MTTVDVIYRYGTPPAESAVLALSKVRDVYGIRRVELREAEKTVCVEYDATRLNESTVHQLLRRAGLQILDIVPLSTRAVPPAALPPPAAV